MTIVPVSNSDSLIPNLIRSHSDPKTVKWTGSGGLLGAVAIVHLEY